MHKRANILIIASVLLLFVGMIYILFREGGIFTSWLTSLVPIDLPFCGNLIDHSTFVSYISLFVLADSLWYGALLLFNSLLRSDAWYSMGDDIYGDGPPVYL